MIFITWSQSQLATVQKSRPAHQSNKIVHVHLIHQVLNVTHFTGERVLKGFTNFCSICSQTSRPSASPSGSPKCLAFGHWMTLRSLKIHLLTYLFSYNLHRSSHLFYKFVAFILLDFLIVYVCNLLSRLVLARVLSHQLCVNRDVISWRDFTGIWNFVSVSRSERQRGAADVDSDSAVLRLSDAVDRCRQDVGRPGAWLLWALQARPGPAVPVCRPGTRHAPHCLHLQVYFMMTASYCCHHTHSYKTRQHSQEQDM